MRRPWRSTMELQDSPLALAKQDVVRLERTSTSFSRVWRAMLATPVTLKVRAGQGWRGAAGPAHVTALLLHACMGTDKPDGQPAQPHGEDQKQQECASQKAGVLEITRQSSTDQLVRPAAPEGPRHRSPRASPSTPESTPGGQAAATGSCPAAGRPPESTGCRYEQGGAPRSPAQGAGQPPEIPLGRGAGPRPSRPLRILPPASGLMEPKATCPTLV